MGIFSAIAGIIGGGSAKKASRNAEREQIAALDRAIAEQRDARGQAQLAFAPYQEANTGGLEAALGLLGLRGNGVQANAIEGLRNSPLFTTLFDTGEEAILQNAAATGGIRGGNTQRSLADFGSDTLTQVIEQQLGRYMGLADRGLQAAGGATGANINLSSNIANILGQQGQVRAGGILTRGGVNSGIANNVGSALDSIGKRIPGLGFLF